MKRLLTFGLLGPPIGALVLFFIVLPVGAWLGGKPHEGISPAYVGFVIAVIFPVPFAYAFGIVPALLTALLDWLLDRSGIRWRALWCALFGTLVAIPAWKAPMVDVALFALVGAVPAALCSWLTGRKPRVAHQAEQARGA
jgi:hypothetical protein